MTLFQKTVTNRKRLLLITDVTHPRSQSSRLGMHATLLRKVVCEANPVDGNEGPYSSS